MPARCREGDDEGDSQRKGEGILIEKNAGVILELAGIVILPLSERVQAGIGSPSRMLDTMQLTGELREQQ
jgi:hypothetical protein